MPGLRRQMTEATRARGPRARFRPAHRANPRRTDRGGPRTAHRRPGAAPRGSRRGDQHGDGHRTGVPRRARAPRLRREDPRPRRPHPSASRGPSSARGPSRATEACWSTVRQPGPIAGFYQRIKARRGHAIAIVAFHPSSETGVSAAPAEASAHRGAAAARLGVIEVAALPPSHCVSARKRPQTCARTILSRVPRAIAIRPADEALVRCHRAAARWLQACQGGRRAPPRRRAGTAHELPRLRRLRAALRAYGLRYNSYVRPSGSAHRGLAWCPECLTTVEL